MKAADSVFPAERGSAPACAAAFLMRSGRPLFHAAPQIRAADQKQRGEDDAVVGILAVVPVLEEDMRGCVRGGQWNGDAVVFRAFHGNGHPSVDACRPAFGIAFQNIQ